MRQHNTTDSRNCWKTARERERLRARYHIRERVSLLSSTGSSNDLQASCDYPLQPQTHPEDLEQLSECLTYIQKGDRSKFSLSSMDQAFFRVISSLIPIDLLEAHLPRTLQLCTAWFGHGYAKNLESYIGSLDSFSLIEYSVWMGKYSIAGALLIGGTNPCLRSLPSSSKEVSTHWQRQVGARVLQRFFSCFPLTLSTHIVRRVVEMRKEAGIYFGAHSEQHDRIRCSLCDAQRIQPETALLSPCQHFYCEPCFWDDILRQMDSRGDFEDVVVCPVCHVNPPNDVATVATLEGEDGTGIQTDNLSPADKRQISLEKFKSLPADRLELKAKTSKKNKKRSEQDHLASSWASAVTPSLGLTQQVRQEKFFAFVEGNALFYVKGCLHHGVDVDSQNEYGQTALYISVWRGQQEIADLLLAYGANPSITANGGSGVSEFSPRQKTGEEKRYLSGHLDMQVPRNTPKLSVLIETAEGHPGSGSYLVDDAISHEQVRFLLELHQQLPVEMSQEKGSGPCSERSYYCDAQGELQKLLSHSLSQVKVTADSESLMVFPYMRFLNYSKKGTALAPHVDLCRVDSFSGLRSTHTFIVYLTSCNVGGETSLLQDISGEGRARTLARVSPRPGRLLLFPHACPHEGNEVYDEQKIILRGELLLSR